MKTLTLAAVLCAICCLAVGAAQEKDYLQASPQDMQWWRDAKFGLFVHWGPVALSGQEISWSRAGERRGNSGTGTIPVDDYDSFYKRFNPTKFNARFWAETAKAAGMRYVVFTTKHHDGFCMFDTRLTDYKVTNSPIGRDLTKELANAVHKAGLRMGFYYSAPDWHHPDFMAETHAKYLDYFRGQLRELCTNYGKLSIMWFDMGGPPERYDGENTLKMVRTLQPGIIINNRLGLPADYDTPEQKVGAFQNKRAWETCMTIANQWSWRPNDQTKSLKQCLQTLIRCACGDGNLLFNVGPNAEGEIEPLQVQRLREMGAWLKRYGESIYSTRGGPFVVGPYGGSTYRGSRVYVHMLEWQGDSVNLPALPRKIKSYHVLTGGKAVVEQVADRITISVPEAQRDPIDTVIVLDLDGPAADIEPVKLPSDSLAFGKKTDASNICGRMPQYGPSSAVDDDPGTRWATDAGTHAAWMQVDLGRLWTFDRAYISEAFDRVQEFELQYQEGGEWRTFHKGTRIGDELGVRFDPVTARLVRLNILKATEGPTIWEFRLFAPGKR